MYISQSSSKRLSPTKYFVSFFVSGPSPQKTRVSFWTKHNKHRYTRRNFIYSLIVLFIIIFSDGIISTALKSSWNENAKFLWINGVFFLHGTMSSKQVCTFPVSSTIICWNTKNINWFAFFILVKYIWLFLLGGKCQ